ncbi:MULTISPECIES: LysR substrate-binding domain-containing protein [Achromobacter]|uniref:LysR substrate-binding domain-containing protein n=1 Tax=Achromobacter spanius TaxID=217203 RepID=A0ABY8GUJ0_9BURK|nr:MULTISPECIES: LysR substrate-binding domain-containing protein [Achromobacter]WAI82216.1 LysR substrate-binding domain-containing protein [Achromobacter spanius]WEX92304.1 LysR substrate-binding domain-containing protein [Achromobacter sp. SS2-2022]WFP08546.1 LysR substrate-binding domain-containing protein [Achromobacter spanius]
MRPVTFDLDVLRSFVAGVDLGSFGRAADRLGRSTSAISAQMKKLEEQAGVPLLRKAGRGLALTEAGETMLAYGRRLLELNDQAARAVQGGELSGRVRLGMQEDFGEMVLPQVLGQFARAHPNVRIEARVARNAELLERLAVGQLDLVLAWDHDARVPHAQRLLDLPMRWIGPAQEARAGTGTDDGNRNRDGDVPLVAFEAPCLFRTCATDALDRAGLHWLPAFTSPSLAGLWAAVSAGLGLAVRTPLGLPAGVRALAPGEQGLPALPSIALSLYLAQAQPDPVTAALGDIVRQCIQDSAAAWAAPSTSSFPSSPSASPSSSPFNAPRAKVQP